MNDFDTICYSPSAWLALCVSVRHRDAFGPDSSFQNIAHGSVKSGK
jgi:hypothetical protein